MTQKILIVDDEPHIRALMEQTLEDLEDEGVELLTAGDGQQALDLIRRECPQLVFLDVMMPKMNGYEVCAAVKQDSNLRNTYIIMLTAKGQEIDKQKGENMGADIYMTKPFDPDEILQKSQQILGL
ncbi:MAG: response regulator [Leptolyngbya sp. DLM2.Bin15]|jgi:DNA-binding response OmpR family regulator|nr:response regulator [Synechococcales cyanobacterium K32_A2020_035]MBF2095921.1 response regulator [Synechococcales cyanobacterium K44_A2020_017]TVQ19160.1 MAG: response regulator [Leptolyngbya sp. DLM2.Bin15]